MTNKYAALLRQKQVPAHKIMIIFQCIASIIKQIRFMNQQKSVANCAGFTYTAFIDLLKLRSELGEMAENRRKEEDLKKMSLGDHLEELRARLILMLLGVVVGLVVGLTVGKYLINLLEAPYYRAMRNTQQKLLESEIEPEQRALQTNLVRIQIPEQSEEVLQSLKPGDSFLAYIDYYRDDPNNPAFAVLKEPSNKTGVKVHSAAGSVKGLQTITPAEGFLIYMKVSLVFGIVLTSPWLFWQIWAFVSAGLYRHERKFVNVVAPISGLLFMIGSIFFLLVIAPFVMNFFMVFNSALNVESNWTLQNYMSMVLNLTLVFGLMFQSPIGIVFAERMGLVSVKALTSSRKYVFLGCFMLSATITPPDPVSQISLALPLYVLYEGSIIVCRIWKRKREG
ncbi:MAG: twin-arginine translocase subunit TatC [Planctomycetota bacterium]